MDTTLKLTANFAPQSKAGRKFAEFYKNLEEAITCSIGGENITTEGYTANRDKFGNIKIHAPDGSQIDAIDGSHPDYSELAPIEKEAFVVKTLLDAATKHKMLNTEEGLKAIAKDIKKGPREAMHARVG